MLLLDMLIRFETNVLTVLTQVEIDVAISKRDAADRVQVDTHGHDGSDLARDSDEH